MLFYFITYMPIFMYYTIPQPAPKYKLLITTQCTPIGNYATAQSNNCTIAPYAICTPHTPQCTHYTLVLFYIPRNPPIYTPAHNSHNLYPYFSSCFLYYANDRVKIMTYPLNIPDCPLNIKCTTEMLSHFSPFEPYLFRNEVVSIHARKRHMQDYICLLFII